MTVLDRAVNVANLGGNLRLAAVANDDGFVTHVVLAWLPLADDAEQPQQNAQFQGAFAVLVRTVNPGASSSQQAGLAADLGISPSSHRSLKEPRPGLRCRRIATSSRSWTSPARTDRPH